MVYLILICIGLIVGFGFLIRIVHLRQSNKSQESIDKGVRNCVIGMFISFIFSLVISFKNF